MKNRPKILILTSSSGHISMGRAAEKAYQDAGLEVKFKSILGNNKELVGGGFKLIYDYFPFLTGLPYQLGKKQVAQKIFELVANKKRLLEVKKEISNSKPDIVLSTTYYFDPAIKSARTKSKHKFFYFYLSHEPWSDHPLLFPNTPDLTFVYDQRAKKIAEKWSAKNVTPIGWLIRPQFYKKTKAENSATLKKLGFKDSLFTILICAGSGTTTVLKIFPALFRLSIPTQIIFVSGRSKTAYKISQSTGKILNKSFANWESRVKLKTIGFTKDLDKYIKISDLVIGKAGPQLLFETIAAEKPFFAVSHLAGHQDSLLELIKRKRLGFVEERPQKAIQLLLKISKKYQKNLSRFNSSIKRERDYNFPAAKKLVSETLKFWQNH